jgi:hypothetical protein
MSFCSTYVNMSWYLRFWTNYVEMCQRDLTVRGYYVVEIFWLADHWLLTITAGPQPVCDHPVLPVTLN